MHSLETMQKLERERAEQYAHENERLRAILARIKKAADNFTIGTDIDPDLLEALDDV